MAQDMIRGTDPVIHPCAKKMDPRVSPLVTSEGWLNFIGARCSTAAYDTVTNGWSFTAPTRP